METKIHIGRNVNEGGKVFFTSKEWLTHLEGIGLTRSGKSMLILLICIALIEARKAFLLLDPHGSLYRDVLAELARRNYKRDLVLFDPSYEKRVIGANFFTTPYKDEQRITTKAERLSQQLVRSFGLENTDQFGNIEKYLRAFFYTILDRGLSICDLQHFLYWEFKAKRDPLIDKVSSEAIRAELRDLYSNKVEFDRKIGPVKNKLQRLIHPQMRRIMGLPDNNIDFKAVIEKQRIMLCNLQPSENDLIGRENTRALGMLLISEFWEQFIKRTDYTEFYLIADEAQEYFGPDLAQILPASAKRGLHLALFHQDKGQLTPALTSAMKNAQTKIIFSTEENPKEQRRFIFRKANGEEIECEAPLMPKRFLDQKRIDKLIEYHTQYFMTPEQVDARLKTSHNESNSTKEIDDPEDE